MREAVRDAFILVTGAPADFLFSGWGGELTESEKAVVENRLPNGKNPSCRRLWPRSIEPTIVNWKTVVQVRLRKREFWRRSRRWVSIAIVFRDPWFEVQVTPGPQIKAVYKRQNRW